MIDIFRNPAYQLFFSIKKVMCDACVIPDSSFSLYLLQITNSQTLHLVFNVMTHFIRGRAVCCLLTTLKCVFAIVVHTEAVDGMELNVDHYYPPD